MKYLFFQKKEGADEKTREEIKKMNWNRIKENSFIILISFVPLAILLGIMWFILLINSTQLVDVLNQNEKNQVFTAQIEIIRTQIEQIDRTLGKRMAK